MNQEMLCTWLGLPKNGWPPDACTLLGVASDCRDLAAIEQRVQECMAKLRCYQLSYPEEATEGMNRLAEAFLRLTELNGKSAPCEPPPAPKVETVKPARRDARDETFISNKVDTKVDWRNEPPPVRVEFLEGSDLPEPVEEQHSDEPILIARPFVAPAKPHRREVDRQLVLQLATESNEASSNLGTLDAVISRVEMTRHLLHLWDKLGKHLNARPKKSSPKESDLFASRLEQVEEVLHEYPAFLGQPAKPGYRVVVQARLKIPLATIRAMNDEQRDDLLFDWHAGRQVLLAHRRYLLRLFKSMRHRSSLGLVMHAVRSALNDYPWLVLLGLAVAAGLIALAIAKLW